MTVYAITDTKKGRTGIAPTSNYPIVFCTAPIIIVYVMYLHIIAHQ